MLILLSKVVILCYNLFCSYTLSYIILFGWFVEVVKSTKYNTKKKKVRFEKAIYKQIG